MPTLLELERDAAGCIRCGLAAGRTTVVFGMGNPQADLLFVGEGPGAEEDKQGLPFVGKSGQLLDRLILEETGMTRADFYITNTIMCRPPGNRDPKEDELAACWPYLETKLQLIAPLVTVTLGNFATKQLLRTTTGITRLRGKAYQFGKGVLIPTFHPSAALRSGGETVAAMRADLVRAKQAQTDLRAGVTVPVSAVP